MQGGELQLYRDGAFVGRASIDSLLPGSDARIPFGADESIRVVVRDEAKASGEKGLMSKSRIDEHRQRFEITNYHSIPISVEVIDRAPISESKDVRVDVLKGASNPTLEDYEGRAGVRFWKIIAQPREAVAIRHYYAVHYPADRELISREAED